MAEVSQEMILDYIIRKGGLVKNVDLVRHFRKYLQLDDVQLKDRAREVFKERVNTVAFIKAEKGEKYLHLRPEFQPAGGLARPPTGRTSTSSIEDNRYNHRTSSTTSQPYFSDNRSSLTSPTSPTSILSSGSEFSDARTGNVAMSSKSDVVLHSYKPVSTPAPVSTSVVPPSQQNSSKPTSGGSVFSPPASNLSGGGLGGDDFGSSLLAELSSFGTLFESFGTGSTSSGGGSSKPDQTTKPSSSTYGSGTTNSVGPSKTDQTTKPSLSTYGSGTNITSSPSKTTQPSSTSTRYGDTKPPSTSTTYGASSNSRSAYVSGYGLPTNSSSPAYGGTSSVSKPTSVSPAQNGTYKSTYSSPLQSGSTSGSRSTPPATGSAGDLSDLLSAFGTTSTTTKYSSSNSTLSGTSRNTESAGDLSELLSAFGGSSLSSTTSKNTATTATTTKQSPSPKRPAPRAPPAAYQNSSSTSQAPQQASSRLTPSSSRGGSTSELQQPSSSGPSTPRTSASNLHSYQSSSTPPKRPAPGVPTSGTASPKTSTSSLGRSGTPPRSQLSGGYGMVGGSSSPAARAQPASSTNYSLSGSRDTQQQQQPRQVTPPRSSMMSPPAQTTTNMNSLRGSSDGTSGTPKRVSPPRSHSGSTVTANKTSDYSSHLGFFDMELMNTFSSFGVGTSSITAPKTQQTSSSSPPKKLGPSVETPTMNGGVVSGGSGGHRRVGSTDASSRRQGSIDMAPSIRVDSPTMSSESSSPVALHSPHHSGAEGRGRSPTYTALGPGLADTRGRAHTAVGSTDSLPLTGGVQLRNKDGKKVGGSAAVRRSRNLDKNANLENMTRLSISMSTPPAVRRNKGHGQNPPPPDVAPKPFSREVLPARSREDIALEGDDVGSMTEVSEQDDYWEIDPLEKEWMLAAAQANLDGIHRLIMQDNYLVNRKDFIHGYTALHWAAKHGRCDIITVLIMSGAMVDIKSGLTPLHLAAQSGHDNAVQLLIKEHGASTSVREHGGRRPIDMLNDKASERTRATLSNYYNHGLPTPKLKYHMENLSTFSQPHQKLPLNRSWSSVGDLLIDKRVEVEKNKKRTSPHLSIRKSFSFKQKKLKEYSPKKDYRRENKKQKKSARPLSEAVPYRYDV